MDQNVFSLGSRRSSSHRLMEVLEEIASHDAVDAPVAIVGREVLLSEYRRERVLGVGGFGAVALVTQLVTGRRYAVKVLRASLAVSKLEQHAFAAELATWLELPPHENVVRAYFVRHIEGSIALFMEYVPSGTLLERIARSPLGAAEVASLARSLARGLDHAHANGLVHADIKPDNVLLGPDGVLKISDWGLATALGTMASTNMTLRYRSPEQARQGPLSAATDIWSFGLTVLSMLAPALSWQDGQHARELVTSNDTAGLRQLPARARQALLRCFEGSPARRWPTAGAAAAAMFEAPTEVRPWTWTSTNCGTDTPFADCSADLPALRATAGTRASPEDVGTDSSRALGRWLDAARQWNAAGLSDVDLAVPRPRSSELATAIVANAGFERLDPHARALLPAHQLIAFYCDWIACLGQIGDHRAALAHAEQGIRVGIESGSSSPELLLQMVRIMTQRSWHLHASGGAAFAADSAEMAIALADRVFELGGVQAPVELLEARAHALVNLAQFLTGAKLNLQRAVEAAELACEIEARLVGERHRETPLRLGMAEYVRAGALRAAGRFPAAIAAFRASIAIFEKVGKTRLAVSARTSLAQLLRDTGELEPALRELALASDDPIDGMDGHQTRATIYMALKDWTRAAADFHQAELHLERIVFEHGRGGLCRQLASVRLARVDAYCRSKRYREAEPLVSETVDFLERLVSWGGLPTHRDLVAAHRLASTVALAVGHLTRSLLHGERHLDLIGALLDSEGEHLAEAVEVGTSSVWQLTLVGAYSRARRAIARIFQMLEQGAGFVPNAETGTMLEHMQRTLRLDSSTSPTDVALQACEEDLALALFSVLAENDLSTGIRLARTWLHTWRARVIRCAVALTSSEDEGELAGHDPATLESPSLAAVPMLAALIAWRNGARDEGYELVEHALEVEPTEPLLLFFRYYACVLLNRPDTALQSAGDTLLRLCPTHPVLCLASMLKGPLGDCRRPDG